VKPVRESPCVEPKARHAALTDDAQPISTDTDRRGESFCGGSTSRRAKKHPPPPRDVGATGGSVTRCHSVEVPSPARGVLRGTGPPRMFDLPLAPGGKKFQLGRCGKGAGGRSQYGETNS